ncbi:MAG: hypothetical protein RR393_07975 [Bacteroidales bacterium]
MKKGYIYAVIGVVVVLVFLLFFWDKIFSKKKVKEETTLAAPVTVFPLKKGSKGKAVTELQEYLNESAKYYMILQPLNIDGIFGDLTEGMAVTVLGTREINEKYYNDNIKK